jgi:HK97 family phage major capsid protein
VAEARRGGVLILTVERMLDFTQLESRNMASATAESTLTAEAIKALKDATAVLKSQAMNPRGSNVAAVIGQDGPIPAQTKPRPDPAYGFQSKRDFLLSVMKASQNPNANMDKRLVPLFAGNAGRDPSEHVLKAVGSDEARTNSDPYGGFLIPTTYAPDFLKIDPEADPIGGKTRNVPMASPIVKINARTDKNHTTSVAGGLTVTRRPDTVAATPSQMQVEQVTLEAHDLFGFSYASESLLRDSAITFTALLAAGFSDQFAYALIKERLYGTGVGEFLGILTALDSAGLGPTVSVAKETDQVAATITFRNVTTMRSRCWGYEKAVWLANHDCYPTLAELKLPIGTAGAAMYTPSLVEGRPDMLSGRPIFYTEYCKPIGTQGDLILANWNEYLEGTYQPMQSEESMHVRFINHERAFKFYMRNAGSPWWKSALTPAYSTSKLSPFVVLDARA